jgi:Domain of unknown function (DUF1707)
VVPVTAGPGEANAANAVGRGHLRASHADREQVIGILKAAFVHGRLTKDELDGRVGQTLASRTYGELAGLTADLPTGLTAAPPPQMPARARTRPPTGKVVAGAVLVIPPPAMVLATFLTLRAGSESLVPTCALLLIIYFMVWTVAGAQMFANWHDKRSGRGQLPPRSIQSGQAVEGEQGSTPGNDLILCQAHRDTRARRSLGHSVTQRIWRSVPTRRASAGLCT